MFSILYYRKKSSIFSIGTVENPVGRVTLWVELHTSEFDIHTHT